MHKMITQKHCFWPFTDKHMRKMSAQKSPTPTPCLQKAMKHIENHVTQCKQSTAYFSTLSHVLVRRQASGLRRQAPFFSFSAAQVCDWGFILQLSGGRSLFCWIWNIWSIWGPHPCSALEKWPIHLDLSEWIMVLRSCLLTARQTGSTQTLQPLISLCNLALSLLHSLSVKVRQRERPRFTERLAKWNLASREVRYRVSCGRSVLCQMDLLRSWCDLELSGPYLLLQIKLCCNCFWKIWSQKQTFRVQSEIWNKTATARNLDVLKVEHWPLVIISLLCSCISIKS